MKSSSNRKCAKTALEAPADPHAQLARYRVPILDRTLDFMELLASRPDGMTLTALTEGLAIPKNTAFRIASTLVLRGYAERDEDAKSYRLSRKVLALGHAALDGDRLLQAASPILNALRQATGETALIGTLAGVHGVVLDQAPSPHPVKVVIELGHAFPLHSAAPAKAMLAYLDESAYARMARHLTFERFTSQTLTGPAAYAHALEEVRTAGYALDLGEENESVRCAAAAVFDHHRCPVAALWISGPADRLPLPVLIQAAQSVKAHAAALTARIGGLS